jgi:hypothetical protein
MATAGRKVLPRVWDKQEKVTGVLTEGTTTWWSTGDGPLMANRNDGEFSSRTTCLESEEARWCERKCHEEQRKVLASLYRVGGEVRRWKGIGHQRSGV